MFRYTGRKDHVNTEAEAGVVPPQIKSHQGNHSKLGEAKGSFPAFGGSVALPMPWFGDLSLQCCCKPPSLW